MPLEKLIAFSKKVQDLSDKPNSTMTAAEVKAQFDAAPEEVRQYLNQLIDDLQSNVDGDSGSDNIGATSIVGLSGTTVQSILESLKSLVDSKSASEDIYTKAELNNGQLDNRYYTESELSSNSDGSSGADKIGVTPISTSPSSLQGILEWLKTQIDLTVLGQLPDGSITDEKLSDGQTGIKQRFNAHTADDVRHVTTADRNKIENVYKIADVDPNTTQEKLILTTHANVPDGGGYWYITTNFWAGKDGNRSQQAITYFQSVPSFRVRHNYDGVWTPWSPDPFKSVVDGKNSVESAIEAKGGTVSDVNNPPTFADLVNGINGISTGKRMLSGSVTIPGNYAKQDFTVNTLPFKPNVVVAKYYQGGQHNVNFISSLVSASINSGTTNLLGAKASGFPNGTGTSGGAQLSQNGYNEFYSNGFKMSTNADSSSFTVYWWAWEE